MFEIRENAITILNTIYRRDQLQFVSLKTNQEGLVSVLTNREGSFNTATQQWANHGFEIGIANKTIRLSLKDILIYNLDVKRQERTYSEDYRVAERQLNTILEALQTEIDS